MLLCNIYLSFQNLFFLYSVQCVLHAIIIMCIYDTCAQFKNPELTLVDVPCGHCSQAVRPFTLAYVPVVQNKQTLAP